MNNPSKPMMANSPVITGGFSIASVERETGLSKDVLRVWERRYGFPVPARDAGGERLYSEEQLSKLKLARRLMDLGLRPGSILGMSMEDLTGLLREKCGADACAPVQESEAMTLLRSRQGVDLRAVFQQAIMRDGLYRFLTGTAVPLTTQVGEAWMRGEIEVHEEHLFTEQLTAALRASMPGGVAGSPRVLLTTLPGEPHSLGLLMAEAVLRLEGVETTSLGVQTPLGDVLAAAAARRSDIVALSFSSNFPAGVLIEVVAELRQRLPAPISLWCGGAGTLRVKRLPGQVVRIGRLEDITAELARWRESHQNAASPLQQAHQVRLAQ